MSWLCSCGLANGGTNEYCPASLTWKLVEHKQVSSNTPDWIMSYLVSKEVGMTPQEELFAKFYNHQKVLVKDMDHIQLRGTRDELQKIAFEAKARLVASDDEIRERKAKTSNKEWLVTTDHSISLSDAINVPAIRKSRMSKMDKLSEQLRRAGIEEATIMEMIGNLEKKAIDSKLKTITFNKPTVEVSAVQVKKTSNGNTEPFDPTNLKFGG